MYVTVASPYVEATEDMYECSNLPAAREAGVVIKRKGLWLEGHCIENEISCIGFDTSTDIQRVTEGAMGKAEKKEGSVGKPTRFNSGGDVSIKRSK